MLTRTGTFVANLGLALLLQGVSASPLSPVTQEADLQAAFVPAPGTAPTQTNNPQAPIYGTVSGAGTQDSPYKIHPNYSTGYSATGRVLETNPNLLMTTKQGSAIGLASYKFETPALSENLGVKVAGVNTMTGRHSQSIDLGTLHATGGISYPISLKYTAPVGDGMEMDQRMVQAYDCGYGWDLEFPFIIADNKGTTEAIDDDYYAYLGPWGAGKLVPIIGADGAETFQLANNPNITIHCTSASTGLNIAGWVVQFPDNSIMVLGGRSDAQRMTFRRGERVGLESELDIPDANGYIPDQNPADFIYRWDVTEIRAPGNRGIIRFEWNQLQGSAKAWLTNELPTSTFNENSWPVDIWSAYPDYTVDPTSELAVFTNPAKKIDQVNLTWQTKSKAEVFPPDVLSGKSSFQGTTFPSQFLSGVVFQSEGIETKEYSLDYKIVSPIVDGLQFPKRFLTEVVGQNKPGAPTVDQLKWFLGYDESNSGWLNSFTDPNGVVTSYGFTALSTARNGLDPDGTTQTFPIPVAGGNFTGDQSTCVGEFCYVMGGHDYGGIDVQVYKKSDGGMRQVFSNTFNPSIVIPQDGYFIVGDSTTQHITVYQWNGSSFEPQDPFSGDPREDATGMSSSLKLGKNDMIMQGIIPSGGDYFIVKYYVGFPNQSKSNILGEVNDWNVIPVIHQANGTWTSINRTPSNCDVAMDYSYGTPINFSLPLRTPNGDCMEFVDHQLPTWASTTNDVEIQATPDFFAVLYMQWSVVEIYRRFGGTNTFVNETMKEKFGPTFTSNGFATYESNPIPWDGGLSPDCECPTGIYQAGFYDLSVGNSYVALTSGISTIGPNAAIYTYKWDGINWILSELGLPRFLAPLGNSYGNGDDYYTAKQAAIVPNQDGIVVGSDGFADNFDFGGISSVNLLPPSQPTSIVKLGKGYEWYAENALPPYLQNVRTQRNLVSMEFDDPTIPNLGLELLVPFESYLVDKNYSVRYDLTGGGLIPNPIYDIYISPNEDWITGKTLKLIDGGYELGEYDYYYVPFPRNYASSSYDITPDKANWIELSAIPQTWLNYTYSANQSSPKISYGPGVWMQTYFGGGNEGGSNMYVSFHPLYTSGPVARNPAMEFQVVSSVTTKSLYQSGKGTVTSGYNFTYGSGNDLVYNGILQEPESAHTTIQKVGQDLTTQFSTETIDYYSERVNVPLRAERVPLQPNPVPNSWLLAGQVKSTTTTLLDGTLETDVPSYRIQMQGLGPETVNWAPGAFRIIQDSITHVVDDRGSTMTRVDQVGNFDPITGLPRVRVSYVGSTQDGVEGTEYRHLATVTNYNSASWPIETRTAKYLNQRDAQNLVNTVNDPMSQLLSDCAPGSNGKSIATPISGLSANYASNNLDTIAAFRWGQTTEGADPNSYSTSGEALIPQNTTMDQVATTGDLRSPTGSPQFQMDNTTNITTSYVYEGIRGQPSAVAWNALPNNVAVLTAEDGMYGLNGTWDGVWNAKSLEVGFWETGNATYDASMAHTGQYSLKLTGSGNSYPYDSIGTKFYWLFGPTRNVYLKNVSNLRNGITVSVWIYSTGIPPVLAIEQRQADGTPVGEIRGCPVGGNFVPNCWQQWKIFIPKSSLLAANFGTGMPMFTSDLIGMAGDYLRAWVGFSTPIVNNTSSTGTLWVDDIVIAPSDARVTLQSYDYAGRVVGAIDPDGHTSTIEYGPKGEVQAVRDERGRIFNQNAVLQAEEK